MEFVAVGESVLRILERGNPGAFTEIDRGEFKNALGDDTDVSSQEHVYLSDSHQVYWKDSEGKTYTLDAGGNAIASVAGVPADGQEKDAVNLGVIPCVKENQNPSHRSCSRIFVGRTRWREKKDHFEDQAAIALHEFAGVLGVELDRYDVLSTRFRESLGAQRLETEQFKQDLRAFLLQSTADVRPSSIDWKGMISGYQKLLDSPPPEFERCVELKQDYYDDLRSGDKEDLSRTLDIMLVCEQFYKIAKDSLETSPEWFYQEQLKKMEARKENGLVELHAVLEKRKAFLERVLEDNSAFKGAFGDVFRDGVANTGLIEGTKACDKKYASDMRKMLLCTIEMNLRIIRSKDFQTFLVKMDLLFDKQFAEILETLNRYEE